MAKLNKQDLVEIVSEEAHLSKKDARAAVDLIFDSISESLLNNQEVNITNFGVFTPIKKHKRDGTDPKTHTRIVIKEKQTVSFKPCKSFKNKLNK